MKSFSLLFLLAIAFSSSTTLNGSLAQSTENKLVTAQSLIDQIEAKKMSLSQLNADFITILKKLAPTEQALFINYCIEQDLDCKILALFIYKVSQKTNIDTLLKKSIAHNALRLLERLLIAQSAQPEGSSFFLADLMREAKTQGKPAIIELLKIYKKAKISKDKTNS